MRIALDVAAHHVIEDGALTYRGGDRWSAAHDALAKALRIDGDRVALALEDGMLLDVTDGRYTLSPFELRYAADHGRLHPLPAAAREAALVTPITDLHSHYAACLSGDDLLAIGLAHDLSFPRVTLLEAGVHTHGDARLCDLPSGARDRLARAFVVPLDRRITFLDMERIYRVRSPITKALVTLPAILRRAAEDYARMGIRYVELSLGTLNEAAVLREIHRVAPAIEDETGVTLRFLLALSRHNDPEWNEDMVRRLATLEGSVYVAGIDIMGHETNSTRAFAPTLRAVAAWATAHRPGFVVRVHAGESPSHPENVRQVIEETEGATITLRIGHGLYGVDDATLDAIVRTDAIVELNLDSNIALNHVESGVSLPLRRYVDRGARVVLGSDGYGIYGASAWSAARAALIAGLTPADLRRIRETESAIVDAATARDARASRGFDVPDDLAPVCFTPEVISRRRAEAEARDRALASSLSERGITLLSREELVAQCAGRAVVSVAGAWQSTWATMSDAEREAVEQALEAFVGGLDPAQVVVLTGGTRFGVEGFLAERFPVIAAIVAETPPESLAAVAHAVVIAPSLYEKAARLYELVDDLAGACVFVSGGQIVKDEIQAAKNLGLPYVVLEGHGASGSHAREEPARAARHGRALADFVVARPAPRVIPFWYTGANPTVDAVVVRAGREVLLVRRSADAPAFASTWALPGGFVATDAPRGGPWQPGRETDVEACVRELREETSLEVDVTQLRLVGVFEGGGRDPRDSVSSFSRSTAFLVELPDAPVVVAGGDDAEDAQWFPLEALPARLAFDHREIVTRALEAREIASPPAS